MPGCCKNPVGPKPAPHGGDRIGKRSVGLAGPQERRSRGPGQRKLGVQQGYHREQPEQARGGPQHRLFGSTAGGFQTQIGTHLLKRGFDGPATGVGFDDRSRHHRRIGGVEILVAVGFAEIVDKDPAKGNQAFSILEPVPESRQHFDAPPTATVPTPPSDANAGTPSRPLLAQAVSGPSCGVAPSSCREPPAAERTNWHRDRTG